MIEYVNGSIFDSKAIVIVNPVNTMGIMGKGLALDFKQRYPRSYRIYEKACKTNLFKIGNLMLTKELDHDILMFPTKTDWRLPSKLEYIEAGLKKFVLKYKEKGIESIAFPMLGCGFGGLNWKDVKILMEKYLSPLPIKCYIYICFRCC